MHLGHNNRKIKYEMGGMELDSTLEEKDLGVIFNEKLQVGKQCLKAANKANQILGMIKRTFVSRKKELIIPLYKSLVRPHLDYCKQAWRPHLRKDIDVIERVQRRATRLIDKCRGFEYGERLTLTKLTTLETRHDRSV